MKAAPKISSTNSLRSVAVALSALFLAAALSACATADRKPLVQGPTTSLPKPSDAQPATAGSLFTAASTAGRFRPLFEDARARNVGDIVTVVLNERTVANRSSNASAEKTTSMSLEADLSPLANIGPAVRGLPGSGAVRSIANRANALGQSVNGLSAESALEFEGKGAASAQNAFTGTITATVIEVLPNGNLVIAGEKQLAVSSEEEIIRLSGVVTPSDVVGNSVNSTRIADLRLEYRGRGFGDDTNSPGWLTRGLLKILPF